VSVENLILCYRHDAIINGKHYSTFCGLGDIIRGFVHCFLLSRFLNIKFYVNFDNHCLRGFVNTECLNFDLPPPDIVPFTEGSDLELFIRSHSGKNLFLMTSGDPLLDFPKSSDLSNAFESIFLGNSDILNFIKSNFSSSDQIFHARFGDNLMVDKGFIDDYYLRDSLHPYSPSSWSNIVLDSNKYKFVYEFFEEKIGDSDFVSSDHLNFKYFLKNKIDISFIDHEPCHVGIKDSDYAGIFHTLCDFYLMFFCKKFTSVGSYPFGKRVSGFSFWPSFMKDIDCTFYSFDLFRSEIRQLCV
jgi:hypothetical protein